MYYYMQYVGKMYTNRCMEAVQLNPILLQTMKFFIWDQIKQVLVQLVLVPPIIAGLLFFIKWGGEYFYVYTWLFVFVVTMVSNVCVCVHMHFMWHMTCYNIQHPT